VVFFTYLFCFSLTTGHVLGIVTLGLSYLCLILLELIPQLMWLAGAITSHLGLRSQIKRTGESGRKMAITGLVSSYIGLGLLILLIIVFVLSGSIDLSILENLQP
jgi:hypothetical protein